MNKKQTWILVAIAVALFLYIRFFERGLPGSGSDSASRNLVRTFQPGEVSRILLLDGESGGMVLERAGTDHWQMREPMDYPAQAFVADIWLQTLSKAQWQLEISAREQQDEERTLGEFGLGEEATRIVLEGAGDPIEVHLGDTTPAGKSIYLQVQGDDSVYIADAVLKERFPTDPREWRDRFLLNPVLYASGFNRLEVRALDRNRGYSLRYDKPSERWTIDKPIQARGDTAKIFSLLEELARWQVTEFVTDSPAAELEPMGLLKPAYELAIGNGTNDLVTVQFGHSPTNQAKQVYARLMEHTNVVKAPKDPLTILAFPYSFWRDNNVIHFKPPEIRGILSGGPAPYRIARTNNQWRIVEPESLPADAGYAETFLATLNTLQISEFEKDVVTDFSEYGLAQPIMQFELLTEGVSPDTTNNPIPRISFGSVNERFFVRRSDESAVYEIGRADFNQFPRAFWQWRDRQIWNFKTNQVRRIRIDHNGRKREIIRTDKGEYQLAPGSSGVLDLSIGEAVYQMRDLSTEHWLARGGEFLDSFGFATNQHRVSFELEVDGRMQTNSVSFGGFDVRFHPYAAVELNDGKTWIFEFPAALFYEYVRPNFLLKPDSGRTEQ